MHWTICEKSKQKVLTISIRRHSRTGLQMLLEQVALVEQAEQVELAGQVGLVETLVLLAIQGVKATQG